MRSSILAVFVVALSSGILFSASAHAKPIHQKRNALRALEVFGTSRASYDFRGIVKLSNCSGSLIRFQGAKDADPGLVLTNGHCVSSGGGGMMPANRFMAHVASRRTFQFLDANGAVKPGQVAATELVYGTITWNDVAIYSLEKSYAEIRKAFGIEALIVDSNHPKAGDGIDILSGYWQRGYSCSIDRFVYELHEAEYVSRDSMRYSKGGCETIHGTSGSPILNARTRAIVGINSTGNDDGERCTMDNPCEVSENGQVYFEKGRSYGDQTWVFYTCLNPAGKIDVSVPGCKLYH
ncbi:MAG: serine protease [Proteobacteria bacterium]|nr:serine protease [Pseudomonadota bacterium]